MIAKTGERMRKSIKGLLATAVLGSLTMSASAVMTITSTREIGSGTAQPNGLANFDIIRFYAKFDNATTEGAAGAIGLQSVKATLTTPDGTFKFRTVDLDGSPVDDNDTAIANDYDVQLSKTNKSTARTSLTAVGTAIRAWDFNNSGAGDPDATFTVTGLFPTGNTNANPGPPPNYQNLKEFRVEGALLNPAGRTAADTQAKVASVGSAAKNAGALFAIAVVPHDATVTALYDLAADKGDHSIGSETNFAPEPGTFALLGLGVIGAMARRGRKA